MNLARIRQFDPVTLGRAEADLHPREVDILLATRSHKPTRRLAIIAKSRLRYLLDQACLEAFLEQAARHAIDGRGTPAEWLQATISALDVELAQTRFEHMALAERLQYWVVKPTLPLWLSDRMVQPGSGR